MWRSSKTEFVAFRDTDPKKREACAAAWELLCGPFSNARKDKGNHMAMLLGIDLGTQSVKASLIDSEAGLRATAGEEYPVLVPQIGWAEEEPDVWWEKLVAVLGKLREQAPNEYAAICCIGITGQMHGLVMLDAELKPFVPAIVWLDQRSAAQVQEIEGMIGTEVLAEHVQNRIFPGFALPSLLWVKQEKPDIFARITRICAPKDYVRLRLTGKLACDVTDASATTMFDLPKRTWFRDLTDELGFGRSLFPECHESTEIAGCVTPAASAATGLREGIPVIYGAGDQSGLTIGNGLYKEGTMVANIGTGGTMATISSVDTYDPKLRLHTFCNAVNGSYSVFGAILGGGICMRWLRDSILGFETYALMSEQAGKVAPGSDGLVFLPYLGGERTPYMDPEAEGMFLGLRLIHTRAHFVRAVMEGIVFALKDSLCVLEELGLGTDTIIASGGGARSSVWLQIQADIFGKKLMVTDIAEQGSLGIAILAGVGAGVFGSVEEGCAALVRYSDRTFAPIPENVRMYEERYDIFREAYQKNAALMHRNAAFVTGKK